VSPARALTRSQLRGDKRERVEEEDPTRHRVFYVGKDPLSVPDASLLDARIDIKCDGACRNNGTPAAVAAIGVFVQNYLCAFSSSTLLPTVGDRRVFTNGAAEILAAANAARVACKISSATGFRRFSIFSDSESTVLAIAEGTPFAYRHSTRLQNIEHWRYLADQLQRVAELQLDVAWHWVPRHLNKEPDELCNAALDRRSLILTIASLSADPPTLDTLQTILQLLTTTRRSAMRRISRTLEPALSATANAVLVNYAVSPRMQRAVFLLLPHLLSLHQFKVIGRSSFRELRTHVSMLQDVNYCNQAIFELKARLEAQPRTTSLSSRPAADPALRIASLVRQELYGRLLGSDDARPATPSPQVLDSLRSLFPQRPLPQPLPHVMAIEVPFGEIVLASNRLRKGKTPGLTAWTRELLTPALVPCHPQHRRYVMEMFTAWVNMSDDVTPAERDILTTGILSPLQYPAKAGKIRPIVMTDMLLKLLWLIALHDVVDPALATSTHVFGKRGACQLVATAVQAALDSGETVAALDATNAFNTLCRHEAFAYIARNRHQFHRAFHLLNATYARATKATWFYGSSSFSIDISAGTIQGCSSSLWFYTCGTMDANLKINTDANGTHAPVIAQAADDVYIIRNALANITRVIETYKTGPQQHLDGPKMRFLSPTPLQLPERYRHVPVVTTPTRVLGAVIAPNRQLHAAAAEPIAEIKAKLFTKYSKIASLPTSTQTKWLVLLNITMHATYYMEACAIGSREIAAYVDELQLKTFSQLFDVGVIGPNLHDQLHLPIEVGGMGLFPYSPFHWHFRKKTLDLARPFVTRFGITLTEVADGPTYRIMELWNDKLRTDIFGTRDWRMQRVSKSWLSLPLDAHESFLRIAPAHALTTFSDDEMVFAVQHRLERIPPLPRVTCVQYPNRDLTGHKSFNEHFAACPACSTYLFRRRHEAVLNAFYKCCRFHGYDAELVRNGSRENALPGNSRGGADMLVHKDGKTYVIDVTICKEGADIEGRKDRLAQAFKTKGRKYEAYQQQNPTHVVFPFAMNVHGLYHPRSVDLLTEMSKSLRTDTFFRTDVLRHTQVALQKAIHEFYSYKKTMLVCMSSTLSYAPLPVTPPQSDTEDREVSPPAAAKVKQKQTKSIPQKKKK
jgi:ribonuclease HI